MTDAEHQVPGCISREFFLSDKAAKTAQEHPEGILHNRLFDREDAGVIVYEKAGQPLFGIETNCYWSLGIETVFVRMPEEVRDGEVAKSVRLDNKLTFPLFPFELKLVQNLTEQLMSNNEIGYSSSAHPGAIYRGSSPFDVYQAFQIISKLRGKDLLNIRRVVELGSGLSVISMVISIMLSRIERITAIDYDKNLVQHAVRLKSAMQNRFGYRLSAVQHRAADIFSDESAELIRQADAAIGWFPINHRISDYQMQGLLRLLKPGKLFFQMYNTGCPLSVLEDNASKGFKQVMLFSRDFIPLSVFRRT